MLFATRLQAIDSCSIFDADSKSDLEFFLSRQVFEIFTKMLINLLCILNNSRQYMYISKSARLITYHIQFQYK